MEQYHFYGNYKIYDKPIVLESNRYSYGYNNFISVLNPSHSKQIPAFYHNVKTLEIVNDKESKDSYYDLNKNKIILNKDEDITRELLHASTTVVKDDCIYCGLEQTSDDNSIGKFLSDGLTALYNNKYFNRSVSDYQFEAITANHLKRIIGEEKLEEFYLQMNLKGLLDYYSYYNDPQVLLNVMSILDNVFKEYRYNKCYIYKFMTKIYPQLINSLMVSNTSKQMVI